ncbi:MAG: VOC family protein [Pseudooceanicola sp.]
MNTSAAPLQIGRVVLKVRNLGEVAGFYQKNIGLTLLEGDGEHAVLGAGGTPLLELHKDAEAPRSGRREAGLFHTAFLLPERADLGAFLRHASDTKLPMQGASDHWVSEALYLDDPEGNGIEVYVDRPRAKWTHKDGEIAMATEPLDLKNLAEAAEKPWTSAPDGTVVGHVHLQVGALEASEDFMTRALGMDVTNRYPGANFYASGGYHHHLAGNIWNSRGAGPRAPDAAGLAAVEILGTEAGLAAAGLEAGTALHDPWGTEFRIGAQAA